MSIFKTIGAKLKRVVSLKNVINGVTGQWTALGADVVRVATTQNPADKAKVAAGVVSGVPYVSNDVPYSSFALPQLANDYLTVAGAKQKQAFETAVASNSTVQDVVDSALSISIKAFWLKRKNWIIGAGCVLVASVVAWKVFGKKSASKGRARR